MEEETYSKESEKDGKDNVVEWPPTLRQLVASCFNACKTEEQKNKVEVFLKTQITAANKSKEIWTKRWDKEPLPSFLSDQPENKKTDQLEPGNRPVKSDELEPKNKAVRKGETEPGHSLRGAESLPEGVTDEELKTFKMYNIKLQPDNEESKMSSELKRILAGMDNEEMHKFCQFIGDRVEEEQKDKVSLQTYSYVNKECFGPPEVCHNCQSLHIEVDHNLKVHESLKRCSGCHLVSYCSERCQKEHWYNIHKPMCKMLSKRSKVPPPVVHTPSNCTMCMMMKSWVLNGAKGEKIGYCPSEIAQSQLMFYYWSEFGYHRHHSCECTVEDIQNLIDIREYPMQIPFEMGEILKGDFIDWIDNFLAVLYYLITAVKTKFRHDISKLELETHFYKCSVYFSKMRAKYWYLITNEKYRYVTTHLFSIEVIKLSDQMQLDERKHFYHIDKALQQTNDEHGIRIWDIFLFRLGSFYRLLRLTHYQLYNINSIPKHKQKEFADFKDIHDISLKNMENGVKFLITDSGFFIDHYFEPLMQSEVQCPENALIWKAPPYMNMATTFEYLNTDHLPIMAGKWNAEEVFSSGNFKLMCNDKQAQSRREKCEKVVKAHVNFLFFSQKCHGCLKLCLESHRCSGCRAVRYCSKECLEVDWKVHKDYCKEDLSSGIQNLSIRQFTEDQKKSFFEKCTYWLGKCEPIFKVIITTWNDNNIGMDQIIRFKKKTKNKKINTESENPKAPIEKDKHQTHTDINNEERPTQDIKETKVESDNEENIGQSIKLTDCRNMTEYEFPNDDQGMKSLKVVMMSTNMVEVPKLVSALLKNKYHAKEVTNGEVKNKCENYEHKESDKDIRESVIDKLKESFINKYKADHKDKQKEGETTGKDAQNKEHTCCGMCGKDMDENKDCETEKENRKHKEENQFEEEKISEEKTLPKQEQKLNIKQDNLDKVLQIIEHNRMNHLHGKHFEIRHIKKQADLNVKVCKVVDAKVKKNVFDSRVVCQLKDGKDEKLVSLKQTNLVDICADVEDIKDTPCVEGHIFRSCDKSLKPSYVTKMLKKVVSWAQTPGEEQNRPDQLYRLTLVLKYLDGEVDELLCKDHPDYSSSPSLSENEVFSACLAAVRPGCVGDSKVDFSRFNHLVCSCDKQLTKRFREYIVTGMCYACQAYYIERKETQEPEQYGSDFVMASRAKNLDALTII